MMHKYAGIPEKSHLNLACQAADLFAHGAARAKAHGQTEETVRDLFHGAVERIKALCIRGWETANSFKFAIPDVIKTPFDISYMEEKAFWAGVAARRRHIPLDKALNEILPEVEEVWLENYNKYYAFFYKAWCED